MKQSDFRNSMNQFILRDLFVEFAGEDKSRIMYTIKPEDGEYPSLYRLYMETNDATEYTFCTTYLGGWEHWKALCSSSFFKPYIEKWREELEVKHRSIALAKIIKTAEGDGRDALQAAKYVADYSKIRPGNSRGRPSKQEIAKQAQLIVEDKKRLEEDFLRLQ